MDKKQVLYIHGGESFLNYDDFLDRLRSIELRNVEVNKKIKWSHTLADDLGDDFSVILPQMPNSENAKYSEWEIWFERHLTLLKNDAVLIGCSLGAMFLAKYLIDKETPLEVSKLILMASPVEGDKDEYYKDCEDFVFPLAKVQNLLDRVDEVHIWHSKDDFLVPYEHGLRFSRALPEAVFTTFTDKNHFLVSELPELIELIKN